jgi:hypothetical protein
MLPTSSIFELLIKNKDIFKGIEMKKLLLTINVLLAMSLLLISCGSDDDSPKPKGGHYELVIDGKKVAEGQANEVGYVKGNSWSASLANGDEISILLSSVPTENGKTVQVDGSDITVTVMGKLAGGNYLSVGGTITRESASKFTFETTCKDLVNWINSPLYTISGTIESEAYELVK